MSERRYKVLAVATHPVQYMAPIFRRMADERQLDLQVAYCSLKGAEPGFDPDFQTKVQWDVPLLDGYRWREVPNSGSGEETFWGWNNPALGPLIVDGKFDAVVCYVGYLRRTFWIAQSAAKASGAAFIFGTDAHSLSPRDGRNWKVWLKKMFWPWLFRRAHQVIVPSSPTFRMVRELGIPVERITLTPYAVDNDWWKTESAKVNRAAVRARWNVTVDQPVILFCAKLQPWKRPMDLLCAFAAAKIDRAILIFAGDGGEKVALENAAARLGVADRVRFLGFVNQSQLPALYTAADVMVLPSSYEPFAVVVNEAMCCGCPVIVSDQVGAAADLVAPLRAEFVFPAGNVTALAQILRAAFSNPAQLRETGRQGIAHVETHSPARVIAATVDAVESGVEYRRQGR